jgi:multidrug efflux system outer membrane protein
MSGVDTWPRRLRLRAQAALACTTLLAGCAFAPDATTPSVTLPADYPPAGAAAPGTAEAIGADWWTLFGEPSLDALVAATLQHNTDLRSAAARVDETAAVLGLARAAQWPGLDLQGNVTRSRSSTLNDQPVPPGGPEATTHRLVLSSAFEIDLWGRLRNATAAAQAQLLGAEHARDAVRIALAAATVQAWFGVRALDAQLAVLDVQEKAREQSLALVERRFSGGVASSLEPAQARAALAALRAQRPELQRQRALLVNQIGVLTGTPGGAVDAASAALPAPLVPPAGLPSGLLQRRPDVRQAEAALRAAQAQVAVARAAVFPTLSLTGTFGQQSADLVDLLKAGARTWSIGPSLLLPLFDGGRNAARTAQAQAQAEQAAIGYQRAAQIAYREVADALANGAAGAEAAVQVEAQFQAAAEALRIAERRHAAGYSSYLEVLDAQRGVQDSELARLRTQQARLDASVALVKALGGGWRAPQR